MNLKNVELLEFQVMGDDRGALISLEQEKNIPFDIARVYYIFDTKQGQRRGFHAHKNLDQVLVCVSGECKIFLDDRESKDDVILSRPDQGLLIGPMVWHEMYDFSEGCVLMVLASDWYYESDYIRDYREFKAL